MKAKKQPKGTTIEIYPTCIKPDWMKVGAICKCLGEGLEEFRVSHIGKNAAVLETMGGMSHGWESFQKLYTSTPELEARRPELK